VENLFDEILGTTEIAAGLRQGNLTQGDLGIWPRRTWKKVATMIEKITGKFE